MLLVEPFIFQSVHRLHRSHARNAEFFGQFPERRKTRAWRKIPGQDLMSQDFSHFGAQRDRLALHGLKIHLDNIPSFIGIKIRFL